MNTCCYICRLGVLAILLWNVSHAVETPYVSVIESFQADLKHASALAVAAESNAFYALDGLNQRIVVFHPQRRQPIYLQTQNKKPLNAPMDMLLREQSFWVADTGNHQIVEFNRHGKELQHIDLTRWSTRFEKTPQVVSLWIDEGLIYWADRANHQICQMHLKMQKLLRCFATYGEGKGELRFPYQMAMDKDGYLYVVDVLNGRVLIFNSRGQFFSQLGRFGLAPGELFRPNGLAIDEAGYIYVSDSYLGRIAIFHSGRFVDYLRDPETQIIKFNSPVYLRIERRKLYVLDSLQNEISQLALAYREEQQLHSIGINKKAHNDNYRKRLKTTFKRGLSAGKNCISCHLSWAKAEDLLEIDIYAENILPVASKKMCYSCHHGVVVESRLAITAKHQHPGQFKPRSRANSRPKDNIFKAFPVKPGTTQAEQLLDCASCHTPHNSDENQEVMYQDHRNSWMRVSNQKGDLCERCHQSKGLGARNNSNDILYSNHPLGIHFSENTEKKSTSQKTRVFVKEAHLKKGLSPSLVKNGAVLDNQQRLICQTCHQIHAGKDKDLLVLSNQYGQLCQDCHQSKTASSKKAARQKGIHPVNIKLKKTLKYNHQEVSEVNCNSCHRVHQGVRGKALLGNQLSDDWGENGEQLCQQCHPENYSANPQQAHQKGIHPANFKLDKVLIRNGKKIHQVNCDSCHNMHNGMENTALYPRQKSSDQMTNPSLALCVSCHQQQYAKDKKEARAKGIHPVNIQLEQVIDYKGKKITQVNCDSCHTVHNGQINSALLSTMVDENKIEQLCIICHQRHAANNKQDAAAKGIHPVNIKLLKPVKIKTKNSLKTIRKVTCLSCHSVHQGKQHTAALLQTDDDGQLCKNCHSNQAVILGTDHDLRITAKDSQNHHQQTPLEAGLCGSCHSMHQGYTDKNKFPMLYAAKTIDASTRQSIMDPIVLKRDQLCINCHQEFGMAKEKIVNYFSHPYQDIILRSNPKQMPLIQTTQANPEDKLSETVVQETINEFGMIACVTCHNPHQWEPHKKQMKSKPNKNLDGDGKNSFLRQTDVIGSFCISCHGIEARLKYKYYHDKKNARGIGVEYLH